MLMLLRFNNDWLVSFITENTFLYLSYISKVKSTDIPVRRNRFLRILTVRVNIEGIQTFVSINRHPIHNITP